MKLQAPENSGYCATVVRVKNLIPLEKCDNVVGTTIFGFQAIVGKDTKIGDIGVVFPAETQLSEEYCKKNNLFRHETLNADQTKKGYLEDNRRVKAMKFRGHVSNALFMPLESLYFVMSNVDMGKLNEGDEFDTLGETKICCKYAVPRKAGTYVPMQKKERRVEDKFFPEHFSTDNYFKNAHTIDAKAHVVVSQKLHGTSIRVANTIVKRKLSLIEKIAKFFGAAVKETEFAYVFGSKKVIKDANNPDQIHYYESDLWTEEGKKLEGLIPENFLVFGELIGWTKEGKPIQVDYTYQLPKGTCRLYIYRVAFVNDQGLVVDLTWDQVKEFCLARGLNHVPELMQLAHEELDVTTLLDKEYHGMFPDVVPIEPGTVDEGVCVRMDGLTPKILKAKSPKFFEHETSLLDKGEADMETTGV